MGLRTSGACTHPTISVAPRLLRRLALGPRKSTGMYGAEALRKSVRESVNTTTAGHFGSLVVLRAQRISRAWFRGRSNVREIALGPFCR
eukprot:1958847-Pyramimonas_sp.AAC.1